MNILVLTSKYPSEKPVKGFTPVVHYFAKEWVKLGHEVQVIHTQSRFPSFFYLLPSFLVRRFESKFGFTFPKSEMNTEAEYQLDGVFVQRFLIFRIFPFFRYFKATLDKHSKRILSYNEYKNFYPDVIVSHFLNPQIILLDKLKKVYNCPASLVLHSVSKDIFHLKTYLNSVDLYGFRSLSIKNRFLKIHTVNNFFMCYSGIDEACIVNKSIPFNNEIKKFIFVGVLISRKHPDKIILALDKLPYRDFQFNIIGDGPEMNNLSKLIDSKQLNSNVNILGYLDRNLVLENLDLHDCFIMISQNEVFGLVYLEAMAKGCIVIASRNEGMQGIIENGVNGFLCEAGDSNELLEIINYINQLSGYEKTLISNNAINTAIMFSEKNVAKDYLDNVSTIINTSK